ncbi:3-ketosphinganine reductase [Exophiala viscosa]|uniref:3-ketosphinganine reductase n=1 Tax=Exophiala viscosa TaxID=2486360 RepID=UPI00219B4C49|nr:3-ketosphinganine reductase [Exophiala viscosa]
MSTATITLASIAVAALSFIAFRMFFNSKDHFPVDGLTAIVTGGSQGLGLAIAQELSSKGANVVIVAQDKGKLSRAVQTLKSRAARPQQKFLDLSFDLRSPDSAPEIIDQVTRWNDGRAPDQIFCCAGNCQPAFFADASIDTLRGQMDTIYWSAAYMAHAALNAWKKPSSQDKKSGITATPIRHIIFTCSTLAFFPVAGYSPYSPAKAAMKAMVDGLNQEVALYNGARQGPGPAPDADIALHIVYPMGILSPGYETENKTKPELTLVLEKDDKPQQPEELAKIILNRLSYGDFMITTQLLGHLMRGAGMGSSVRSGIMDVFWNWLGSLVIIFVTPDFISKCRNWGKEKGMNVARAAA